jgi:hypothetical protein
VAQFEVNSGLIQSAAMGKPKAVGQRGSWFADVLGEQPCIHDYWLKGLHYIDPGGRVGQKQWDEYIAAIREKLTIVLTHSQPGKDGTFARKGYVATYAVANVEVTHAGLELDLVRRITNLA